MDIENIEGLTSQEVKRRQEIAGYNELPEREKRSFFKIIIGLLKEPMIFLLVAIVAVYFVLGDKSEAFVLMISVLVIMSIELYQENRTEKALKALRNLSSPVCDVIRDGQHMSIPSRELVVGDIFLVNEGGRVPADGRLVVSQNIMANESLLTGESVPVDKTVDLKNKASLVFSGTMVVKGHGLAEALAIGEDTEIGKIGSSLNSIHSEKTILRQEIDLVVKRLAVGAIVVSLTLAMLFWIVRGDLLNGLLAGLTLSIAILPEEFPVVLTVFMALGAWRLAKKNVLTRKNQAIESLGSASVLCVDKTGTLTQNRMEVEEITDANGRALMPDDAQYQEVLAYGVLASQIKPFDPMEEAFLVEARRRFKSLAEIYGGHKIVQEYPLDENSLSIVHVWGDKLGVQQKVALKGAPEAVFQLCHLPDSRQKELKQQVRQLATQGLRVIGVAKGQTRTDLPDERQAFKFEFLGLVALADPVRPGASEAVKLCRQAHIRVVMITGDYAETARRIGGEVGLDSKRVITGEELSQMSQAERQIAIKTTSIFGRVSPTHKLLIVKALKSSGEVVAMTGDGVNDAPALKAAHIGIAMGRRGTDVAREAASIVLLDDNFTSIVNGVRLGRRIFANLQKAITYIITVHVPIIMLSLLPVLFGWPIVLLPIHIVFFEFIVDPSCTLIFEGESEEPNAMKKPPRRLGSPLFSRSMVLSSLIEGLVMSLVVLVTYWVTMQAGWETDKSRSLGFLMIVLMNLFLIVALTGRRSLQEIIRRKRVTPLSAVVGGSLIVMLLVYNLPPLAGIFKLAPIGLAEVLVAVILSVVAIMFVLPVRKLARAD